MTKKSPTLCELSIADPPERWLALGFAVEDAETQIGGVLLRFGAEGRGITAWSILNAGDPGRIDGLPTTEAKSPPPKKSVPHPNGATGIDHVVVITPDFDRTAAELARARMALRRVRDGGGFRQGFRRLGPAILELVEANGGPAGPARFWGLVVSVEDLEALAGALGDRLGKIHPAVQSGRRIATLRKGAGLTPKVAFMTAERR